MNGHDRIHPIASCQGSENPERRIALALSILQHRPWAPEDYRHVTETIAALNGQSIEQIARGRPPRPRPCEHPSLLTGGRPPGAADEQRPSPSAMPTRSTLRRPRPAHVPESSTDPDIADGQHVSPMAQRSRSTRLAAVPRPAGTPRCAHPGGQRIGSIEVWTGPLRAACVTARGHIWGRPDGRGPATRCRCTPSWAAH